MLPISAVGIPVAPELSVCPGLAVARPEGCKSLRQSSTRNRLFAPWLSCVRAWAREVWVQRVPEVFPFTDCILFSIPPKIATSSDKGVFPSVFGNHFCVKKIIDHNLILI